jgi:dipeptidyl aminopeptidase/acylaminoacyl peptidase
MVLLVHGGPWARDYWGYDPQGQWLANRGYAVVQVNFRGSTGYGKAFLNAGNGEWGVGAMQDDLSDAVAWAVGQGIAKPDRICILGGSYGGYAALAGLAFTPDLYTCGVDIVGPSNIKTLFESIPPYWAPAKKELVLRVGDVEHDASLNERISPLFHVDKIDDPLMVLQGANDPRVKIAESDQIVAAMREKDLPVTYIVFPDEGHGFARPENRLDAFAHIERFLAQYLGGRAEPEHVIEGSTAEVR